MYPKEVNEIVRGFIDYSLEASRFSHEAHLIVGLWHLKWYPHPKAIDLIRDNIRNFNEAKGGANTDTSGYHETITVFYMWATEQFLLTTNRDLPLTELVNQLLASPLAKKDYPLEFYSKDLLFSLQARKQLVNPDLQKINLIVEGSLIEPVE